MFRQLESEDTKPLIGISACLLGHKVRYDGRDKKNSFIVDVLSQACDFLPVCPEAGAGLGIPRPPVQLTGTPENARAIGREDSSLDVTEQLEWFALEQSRILTGISGFILKSRSPSCGLTDTPVHNPDNMNEFHNGSGIFARILTSGHPALPVCDENMLTDQAFTEAFIRRVQAMHEVNKQNS